MKNSPAADHYHMIMNESNSFVIDQEELDLLKNRLAFAVNSTRTLYYISNIKELVTTLRKRSLPEATEKEAIETILKFIRTRKYDDDRVINKLPFPVLDMIANEIGNRWLDLARYLNLSESTIEEIETRYPNQLKQRAYQVLLIYSNQENCDDLKRKLLNALTKSRRTDLRAKVEKEFQGKN